MICDLKKNRVIFEFISLYNLITAKYIVMKYIMTASYDPLFTIITNVLDKLRISKGRGEKNRTREKLENTAKLPKNFDEKKLCRKCRQDRSIIKFSKIGGIPITI